MPFYGNCDHSGDVETERKGATDGLDGTAWNVPAAQGQNPGLAATAFAFQGDTPRRGAYAA